MVDMMKKRINYLFKSYVELDNFISKSYGGDYDKIKNQDLDLMKLSLNNIEKVINEYGFKIGFNPKGDKYKLQKL